MNSKICIKCNKDKDLGEFFSGNTKKSKNKCKCCLILQDKEYYEKNKLRQKERRKMYSKEYYEKNKEIISDSRKNNYDSDKQHLIYDKNKNKQKISRDKYRSNPDIITKINKQKQEYRDRPEIKEYIKIKNKEYLPIKKEKLKEKRNNWDKF
jgi:hypothetical protein